MDRPGQADRPANPVDKATGDLLGRGAGMATWARPAKPEFPVRKAIPATGAQWVPRVLRVPVMLVHGETGARVARRANRGRGA